MIRGSWTKTWGMGAGLREIYKWSKSIYSFKFMERMSFCRVYCLYLYYY